MDPRERVLDWRPEHDPRSLAYPIRALIGDVAPVLRLWHPGPVLDQGREGACVGFGWTSELLARPNTQVGVTTAAAQTFALRLYRRAQQIDPWPGEAYEGTSVLAGAKVVQEQGMIDGYRWAFGLTDVRDAIVAHGPVVIGVNWYDGMYTAPGGKVTVSGRKVGGHCLLLTGYSPDHDAYRWRNSWGKGYGVGGNAWIAATDLARLLAENGEACVPVGRNRVQVA